MRSAASYPDDRAALRAVITAFVSLIEDEPELYRFAYAQAGRSGRADLVAATEHQIAEALGARMSARLADAGRPTGPAMTWAYGVVGMVQLAAHWWSRARSVPGSGARRAADGARPRRAGHTAAPAPGRNRRERRMTEPDG